MVVNFFVLWFFICLFYTIKIAFHSSMSVKIWFQCLIFYNFYPLLPHLLDKCILNLNDRGKYRRGRSDPLPRLLIVTFLGFQIYFFFVSFIACHFYLKNNVPVLLSSTCCCYKPATKPSTFITLYTYQQYQRRPRKLTTRGIISKQ